MEPGEFQGIAGRTLEDSTSWWPALPSRARRRAERRRRAARRRRLRAVRLLRLRHRHADVRPLGGERAPLLQLPHHRAVLADAGVPADRPQPPLAAAWRASSSSPPASPATTRRSRRRTGSSPRSSLRNGYATFAVGQVAPRRPATEMTMGSPRERWPLGRGFERFYGFIGGETDQYHPDLVHDNHQVDPPRTPEEGYHLTEDLADKAHPLPRTTCARAVADQAVLPLVHARRVPRAAPGARPTTSSRYRGQFDQGWDAWREEVFARQLASGLLPPGTELSERPSWVPAWDSLTADERRLYARMMEVFAGFLDPHRRAGRPACSTSSTELGELDNTIVVRDERQRRQRRGRSRGARSTSSTSSTSCPRASRRTSRRIDDLGAPRRQQPLPLGLGVGRQHAAQAVRSARPTRAASPIR